ncbi:SAVED domain-containing protein [Archangium violaceum]|uniref:SAVED domain-containing protein n=1 Tax=Archangium violaceum TaxID=83451 RepID=UPI002B2B010E|nr:SAVED domain-containing protein [Archangium gephyra]
MDLFLTPRTQALILRYEHDRPVAENTTRDVLKQSGFEGDRDVASFVLHPYNKDTLVRAQREQDWGWAFDENVRFAEALLARERELGLDLPVHLFGCAPLVLMLHLAWCLSRRRLYVYQQSREDGSWSLKADRSQPATPEPFFAVEGLPAARQGGRGHVALIVEVTQSIRDTALAEFQARHPSELLATVYLRPVKGPSERAVQNAGDISRAAEQFRAVLDALHDKVEGAESVLLAMDCPGSLAAAMGTAINAQTQHPLWLHHFNPEQRKYLAVHQISPRPRLASAREESLTPKQWQEKWKEIQDELKKVNGVHRQLVEWLGQPEQQQLVERLGGRILLDSQIDTTPAMERTPLFRYQAGSWKFPIDLLDGFRALRQRLGSTEDWEECIRLLLVHEAYHVQQLGPTSYGYSGSGRTGWVLEAVDYDADAVSVEVALAWRQRHRAETAQPPSRALAAIIWNALESVRVFEQERPIQTLAERRLRRYLIWLFHACRLSTASLARDAHPGMERVFIEIAGLPAFPDPHESYSQQRVRLEGLDKNDTLILALYYRHELVRMKDPGWVRRLLLALRRWDERSREQIQDELKQLFEELFDQHRSLLTPGRSQPT